MTTTDINKIAAKARTLLEGISSANAKHDTLVADRNARVKPLLEQVHHTLVTLKQPVEGVTTWEAWAQKAGWSKRNLNFILNGRPSQSNNGSGNSSSRPKLELEFLDFSYDRRKRARNMSFVADFYPPTKSDVADLRQDHVKLSVTVQGANSRETLDACAEKMTALMKQLHLWKDNAERFKQYFEELANADDKKLAVTPTKKGKTHAINPVLVVTGATYCGKHDVTLSGDEEPTCQQCAKKWRDDKTVADFKAKRGRYANWDNKEVKHPDELFEKEMAMYSEPLVPEVLADKNCPPENLAPEVVDVLERRKKNMALGFTDGLLPADGTGEEPEEVL